MTAQVPPFNDPSCAAVSMPRARPETTRNPCRSASSAPNLRAKLRPFMLALRAPTMATAGRSNRCGLPEHHQQWWRIFYLCKKGGIAGFAATQEAGAESLDGVQLTGGVSPAANAHAPGTSAAPRQVWQRTQCLGGGSESIQQAAERDRPHVLTADEAQPVQTFGGAQRAVMVQHDAQRLRANDRGVNRNRRNALFLTPSSCCRCGFRCR